MYAEDGTSNDYLDRYYATLQISPGSLGINFDQIYLFLIGTDNETSVEFNSVVSDCDASTTPSGKYNVKYIINNSAQSTGGYLMPGDFVEICFSGHKTFRGQRVSFRVTPKNSQETTINFITNNDFARQFVNLYP